MVEACSRVSELISSKALAVEHEGFGLVHDAWGEPIDNQLYVISREEALVFGIDPRMWPRMWAAIHAFENYTGFCNDESYPDYFWEDVRRDRPDIPQSMENVEAFAEFCVAYAGLSAGQAYRAWYKLEVWHFRAGHHLYPTCSDRGRAATTP